MTAADTGQLVSGRRALITTNMAPWRFRTTIRCHPILTPNLITPEQQKKKKPIVTTIQSLMSHFLRDTDTGFWLDDTNLTLPQDNQAIQKQPAKILLVTVLSLKLSTSFPLVLVLSCCFLPFPANIVLSLQISVQVIPAPLHSKSSGQVNNKVNNK